MAQRVGRGIALLFHDHGTRKRWVVSSTPRPYFTPGKDPVPIVQEARWAPGPVWTGGKSRPTGIRYPDLPTRSQSLYRLSYPAYLYPQDASQIKTNLGPVLVLYFFKLLFNIMLLTARRFSKKSHPCGVSTQNFLTFLNSYSYALYFVQLFLWLITLVMLRMRIMWLLFMQFFLIFLSHSPS